MATYPVIINAARLTFPEDTTVVGNGFSSKKKEPWEEKDLKAVVIPSSVKSFDSSAFSNCSQLAQIGIGRGYTDGHYLNVKYGTLKILEDLKDLEEIGNYAFDNCESLETEQLTAGAWHIGNLAFSFCPIKKLNLEECVEIGYGAFQYCGIEELTLPHVKEIPGHCFLNNKFRRLDFMEETTSIGEEAFRECRQLTTIYLPDGLKAIGKRAFFQCDALTEVEIPEGVTTVGDEAFAGCKSLKRIIFPKTLQTLGADVLKDCPNLEELVMPSGRTEIPREEFKWHERLKKLVLPVSLKTIGFDSFRGCKSIEYVSLPEGLEKIDAGAFQGCGLKELRLPESVKEVGVVAFAACPIEKLIVGKNAGVLSGKFDSAKLLTVEGLGRTVPHSMFSLCKEAERIVLPDTIEEIEDFAFFNCGRLESISPMPKLRKIGMSAFRGCKSLKSISIPDEVELEHGVFEGCNKQLISWVKNQEFFKRLSPKEQKNVLGVSSWTSRLLALYLVATILAMFTVPTVGAIMILLLVLYYAIQLDLLSQLPIFRLFRR